MNPIDLPDAGGDRGEERALPRSSALLASLFEPPVAASELRASGDMRWLHPEERKLLPHASRERLAEFAAGRACARHCLRALGLPDTPVLLRGARREPLWPEAVVGSITHTQGYCGAVLSLARDCAGLGIDAEQLGRVGEELWPRLFTSAEQGQLTAQSSADRPRLATLLFAAKEAFFKSQFALTGATPQFDAVDVRLGAGLAAQGTLCISACRDPLVGAIALPLEGRYALTADLAIAGFAIPRRQS